MSGDQYSELAKLLVKASQTQSDHNERTDATWEH